VKHGLSSAQREIVGRNHTWEFGVIPGRKGILRRSRGGEESDFFGFLGCSPEAPRQASLGLVTSYSFVKFPQPIIEDWWKPMWQKSRKFHNFQLIAIGVSSESWRCFTLMLGERGSGR